MVGKSVKETKVVEHLVQLKQTAKEAGIPVFYSPHYYTENEFKSWKHLNPIDKIMFDRKMFSKGTWRADVHPELQPDNNTFVLALHTGLSNFWTGFDVIAVIDAITGAGPENTHATDKNYGLIANEVTTTENILKRLKE